MTQQDLAQLLGVQPRLVSRWETGKTKPQFNYIVHIADVLEVSLDRLVRGSNSDWVATDFHICNKRLQELCRQVDMLGREDQEVVCHVMDSLIRKEKMKTALSGTLTETR